MSPQFYMRILSSFMANVNIIANNKKQNFLRLLCSIIWIVPLWSKSLDFTSFGENASTSIFAKGWDSLGFSKKMVKKTATIAQKMNSLLLAKMPSLRFLPGDGIHYDFWNKWWKKLRKLVRKWIHCLWRKCHHFNFRQGMGFTTIFEKNGEKIAKIGQKMKSLLLAKMPSLQYSPREGIH